MSPGLCSPTHVSKTQRQVTSASPPTVPPPAPASAPSIRRPPAANPPAAPPSRTPPRPGRRLRFWPRMELATRSPGTTRRRNRQRSPLRPQARAQQNSSSESYRTYLETRPPELVANLLFCLIHQTNYLLDQLLGKVEAALP